jgi:23S rRNA pseudouridine2605 synthase
VRLVKYLAHAGVASRRAAERMVAEGRVTLEGAVVTDPARDVAEGAVVAVDGEPLAGSEPRVVYALNKPAGVVSTASDPQGRPTVTELVPEQARLYPVGRLDVDVTGLILLTNDGELANRLTHPRFEVAKTYRATVANPPVGQRAVRALRDGVELEDGPTAPAGVRRLAPDTLELRIHEGRNRQVKRMCAAVGHPVRRLERIAFGPLRLGGLEVGAHRRLTDTEVARLRAAAAGAAAAD